MKAWLRQPITPAPYVHTIIIRDGGMIELERHRLPLRFRSLNSEYHSACSIRTISWNIPSASPTKRKAGFTDSDYKDVTPDYLAVPVYQIIGKGVYTGNVYVRESDPSMVELHPFEIEMLETTMITKQPQSVYVCDGDAFTLSVEARGLNLTYQVVLQQRGDRRSDLGHYQAALTSDKEGSYYVDVYGDYGMESSVTVTVRKNGLRESW